ncbi:MAG TPA: M1 family aminopeptidase [Flavipsychrobacter sp.]|nr:M1 family aminopeptidase [Flavipsychrobacter sp.]
MRKIITPVLLWGSAVTLSDAQTVPKDASAICREAKIRSFIQAKVTVADPAEENYDVTYVKMNVQLDNQSTYIEGDVTTSAKVIVPSMNQYVFELNSQLIIDSFKLNGQLLSATSNANHVRTVNLPVSLLQGTSFTAQVFYHGQPTSGSQFFSTGLRNDQSPTWGTKATYTMSEPYDAKDWWPCKQSLRDKVDSADIWVTVPNTLKAGANGVLKNVTALSGNKSRYEWKTKIPTAYYLLSIAVAPYIDYSYYVHFPNSTDSMLIQNYVYGDNAAVLPFWKNEIDSVGLMVLHFSDLVGRYPFWKEKYGHCMAPLGGGMEHQTMTTQGNFGTDLSAHELFHQWFGDHVTCATWQDIWLNEGFASYGENIFYEKYYGAAAMKADMVRKQNDVMQSDGGTVYVDDTTDENRIFDGRLTYHKGASVVHTLRFVVGNDSVFYAMLRDYQSHFAFGNATTDDFKNRCSLFLKKNLDTFMNQWVYGAGYPVFAASWNQIGDDVVVQLSQTVTANAGVNLFHTPVEFKLTSATGDTVVRVDNSQPVQYFNFKWTKTMTGMSIDPNEWLLNKDLGVTRDITLTGVGDPSRQEIAVYPNPAAQSWTITNLPANTRLKLYDINGKLLEKAELVSGGTATLHAEHYPSGIYHLKLETAKQTFSKKLIKQ